MLKILVSSDHHANWDCLDYWFKVAKEEGVSFIIPGDVVGDYNFNELTLKKGIQIGTNLSEDQKNTARKLYEEIIEFHAKELAKRIDNYKVMTYFLLGNHEPYYFGDLVNKHLTNKELFVDMNKSEGLLEDSGFKFVGISNTFQLMPFLFEIYSESEINKLFFHQRSGLKTISGLSAEKVGDAFIGEEDFEWNRTLKGVDQEIDIFFTHGQIGRGAWRADKKADELPTLLCAAKCSLKAKLTVDGHLHTSYIMKNDLGKPNFRAVGNKAILFEKDKSDDSLSFEELESELEYKSRGGISLSDLYDYSSPVDKLIYS